MMRVLAALGVACAVWFGWTWWEAGHGEAARIAQARDDVLRQSEERLVVLNTVDHHDPAKVQEAWRAATTGQLLDQLTRNSETYRQGIESAKTVTAVQVLGAAVTSLDVESGQARVIAVLQLNVTPDGGQAAVKRSRFDAGLTRTGEQWLLSSVQVVGLSG
jgi:Mce-associated membrane protein